MMFLNQDSRNLRDLKVPPITKVPEIGSSGMARYKLRNRKGRAQLDKSGSDSVQHGLETRSGQLQNSVDLWHQPNPNHYVFEPCLNQKRCPGKVSRRIPA